MRGPFSKTLGARAPRPPQDRRPSDRTQLCQAVQQRSVRRQTSAGLVNNSYTVIQSVMGQTVPV